jgi:hypothetical protein
MVTWEADRHGVEAVVGHRVVTAARGRHSALEYLVRWEGDQLSDSWEPSDLLDACEAMLAEYWATAVASGLPIQHEDTAIVRRHVSQLRMRSLVGRPAIQVVSGRYHLPPDWVIVKAQPKEDALASDSIVGTRLLMRWEHPNATAALRLQWHEGVVLAVDASRRRRTADRSRQPPVDQNAGAARRASINLRVYWYVDQTKTWSPIESLSYGWQQEAPKDTWFVVSSAAALFAEVRRALEA